MSPFNAYKQWNKNCNIYIALAEDGVTYRYGCKQGHECKYNKKYIIKFRFPNNYFTYMCIVGPLRVRVPQAGSFSSPHFCSWGGSCRRREGAAGTIH